jgi:parvulin-like peptidyl-prolyl isomerase
MSKKTDHEHDKDEEKDLEEEEEEEGSEDEEGGEHTKDEEEEVAAAPAKATDRRTRQRERVQARRDHDDHDDEAEDHGHAHDEDEESAEDDPTWWAPHAVMSVLVLVGVLGFFGVFNKVLGPLVGKPVHAAEEKTATAPATSATPANPGTYRARHLLVAYKGAMRAAPTITRTEDEAKARATEALTKAKAGKVKFEDLVKEYSDEPNAGARGGDLGQFRKGQMVPEFQNAVEKLKVGQTSDLVKTAFGYHVILRTE